MLPNFNYGVAHEVDGNARMPEIPCCTACEKSYAAFLCLIFSHIVSIK